MCCEARRRGVEGVVFQQNAELSGDKKGGRSIKNGQDNFDSKKLGEAISGGARKAVQRNGGAF